MGRKRLCEMCEKQEIAVRGGPEAPFDKEMYKDGIFRKMIKSGCTGIVQRVTEGCPKPLTPRIIRGAKIGLFNWSALLGPYSVAQVTGILCSE